MRLLFIVLLVFIAVGVRAQNTKNTQAKGTFTVSGGINRSFYSNRNTSLHTNNLDSTILNFVSSDKGNNSNMQYNAGLGFYLKNHLSLHVEYSTWKYIAQTSSISVNAMFSSFGVGLGWTEKIYKTPKAKFAVSVQGIVAPIVSFSSNKKIGHALTVNPSIRFEFYKRLYIQSEFPLGFGHNFQLQEGYLSDREVKTNFLFFKPRLSTGFFLFFDGEEKCGTCPKW